MWSSRQWLGVERRLRGRLKSCNGSTSCLSYVAGVALALPLLGKRLGICPLILPPCGPRMGASFAALDAFGTSERGRLTAWGSLC